MYSLDFVSVSILYLFILDPQLVLTCLSKVLLLCATLTHPEQWTTYSELQSQQVAAHSALSHSSLRGSQFAVYSSSCEAGNPNAAAVCLAARQPQNFEPVQSDLWTAEILCHDENKIQCFKMSSDFSLRHVGVCLRCFLF